MKCEYCSNTREKEMFVIGASNEPDWVMNEGTGKMSCPDCFKKGRHEGEKAINNHVNSFNKAV